MALPTQLKTKLDALHDIIQSSGNQVVFDKITIASTQYKIRFKREIVDGKVRFQIEIVER